MDNRAEPSLAHGETVSGRMPAGRADGGDAPAAQPDGAAAPPPPSTDRASDSSRSAAPAAPAYASGNGWTDSLQSARVPDPPYSPMMAAARAPSGGSSSLQGSAMAAMAAMASAASGVRGVASRIGESFASLTKPRPKSARMTSRPQVRPRSPGQPPGSWQQAQPARGPAGSRPPQSGQPARSALLSLQRIEPLSVMKFSSLIAVVIWIILFVAVAVVWFALSKLGVFAKLEQTIGLVTYNKSHPGTNAAAWFSAKRVLGYTAVVLTVNAFLFTALATVGAALYNLVTSLTGGVEVTLKETD